ncbi:MAG: DNA primase [Armatimonadetes bacterium]|nr:DNA primase [Armatimonadota bacterium]
MADERDDIRSRVSIVELVGQRVRLTRAGKDWKGLCPFHDDKTPSFTVSERFGTYRCWACGEHGDIFTWVMKTQNVEFGEAIQQLADIAGVKLERKGAPRPEQKAERELARAAMEDALLFFREELARSEAAKAYLTRRDLPLDVVQAWEMGYAPDNGEAITVYLKRKGHSLNLCKELFLVDQDPSGGFFDKFRGRLMFPIRDEQGHLVAFGGRLLGDGQPKYINSSDTPLFRKSRVLYGLHRARDVASKERHLVLCEGYLDVIACHRAKVTTAVASLGTAFTPDHAKLIKRWADDVTLLYDADEAGQKATEKALEILEETGLRVKIAQMPAGDDPDTLLKRDGAGSVLKVVQDSQSPMDFRFRRLEKKLKPADGAFWEEAVQILATAKSDLEFDKHVVRLAGLYPEIPNPVQAQSALRRWVGRVRKGQPGPAPVARSKARHEPIPNLKIHSAEAAIFRGLFEPTTSAKSHEVVKGDQWLTVAGRELAAEILTALPQPPDPDEQDLWVHRIENPEMVQLLTLIAEDRRFQPFGEQQLTDALTELKKRLEQAELQDLKKESGKGNEIVARLKKMRPKYDKSVETDMF